MFFFVSSSGETSDESEEYEDGTAIENAQKVTNLPGEEFIALTAWSTWTLLTMIVFLLYNAGFNSVASDLVVRRAENTATEAFMAVTSFMRPAAELASVIQDSVGPDQDAFELQQADDDFDFVNTDDLAQDFDVDVARWVVEAYMVRYPQISSAVFKSTSNDYLIRIVNDNSDGLVSQSQNMNTCLEDLGLLGCIDELDGGWPSTLELGKALAADMTPVFVVPDIFTMKSEDSRYSHVLSTSDEVQTWGSAGYEWMPPGMEIIAKYPMRGAIAQPTLSFRPVTHIVVTADQGKDPVANPSHAILITRVTIDLVTLKTKLTNLVDNNPMGCHIVLAGHDGTIYLSTSKEASNIPFTTKPAEVINNQGDTAEITGDYAKRSANDIFPWLENMIWDDNDIDTPPPASYQQYEFEDYIVKAQQLPEPLSNFVVIMAMTDNTQSIDVGFRTMSDIVILMAVLPTAAL